MEFLTWTLCLEDVIFWEMQNLWDALTIEDLPNEELRWIARSLGIEAAKKIWRRFRGNHITCPSKIPAPIVRKFMIDNYQLNTHTVAVQAGVSDRTIQRYKDFQPIRDPMQMRLL